MQKRQETDALHNPIVAYSIILSTHLKPQIFLAISNKRGNGITAASFRLFCNKISIWTAI